MTKAEKQQRKGNLWTREKISQLIQLYRQHECLWNHYTEQYKSKTQRSQAVESICVKLSISKFDFGKKIHNLRNQFNSEMKKLERRIEEAGGKADDLSNQRCRWEHFESLMFLRTVIEPRPGGYQPSNFQAQPKKMRFKYDYNSEEESEHLMTQAENTTTVATLPAEDITEYHFEDTTNDVAEPASAAAAEDYNYEDDIAIPVRLPNRTKREEVFDEKFKPSIPTAQTTPPSQVVLIPSLSAQTAVPNRTAFCTQKQANQKHEDSGQRAQQQHHHQQLSPHQSAEQQQLQQLSTEIGVSDLSTPATSTNSASAPATCSASPLRATHNKALQQNASKTPTRDQWDIFGELIASEFRNLNSDVSRKKLKRKIMHAMLEVGEEDDHLNLNISAR